MEATIKLLKEMGLSPASIERCIAGATSVSVNIFEGNGNVVVIGGNYFESGSKGRPSRKPKGALKDNSLESLEQDMGEAEPESEQPPSERDTSPPPPEAPSGPDPDLVQQVRDHLAQLQVELDDVNLDSFTEDGLQAVLAAQNTEAAEDALADNEPAPF